LTKTRIDQGISPFGSVMQRTHLMLNLLQASTTVAQMNPISTRRVIFIWILLPFTAGGKYQSMVISS
jgi:hypothetical protein